MQIRRSSLTLVVVLALTGTGLVPGRSSAAPVADHRCIEEFEALPDSVLDAIRMSQDIFYAHTSHGSQLVTGMNMLRSELGSAFDLPSLTEITQDLGTAGSLDWVATTRSYLAGHPGCTLVVWSWCGGVSSNTDEGIDSYLAAMDALEGDYPDISFVYMTGHLDGTGDEGVLRHNNERIRDFCLQQDKILFDFADIESWDPAGVRYPDETDACSWCTDWCSEHDCPACAACAHSHCYNCYIKGKAFWWLLARITGWIALEADAPTLDSLKAMYR